MAQSLLTPPEFTADEIKVLRQRYLDGTLSEAGNAAFERSFPHLVPKSVTPITQSTPTAPSVAPGELTPADIGRIPLGAARGAVSTVMGAPADLVNLLHMLGNLPLQGIQKVSGVPIASAPLNLPGGSAQYRDVINRLAQYLGYTSPESFSERLMEFVPEEIANNLALAGGLSALRAPAALTGGTRATDILMGTGAGAGRTVGAEGGPTGEAVGGIAGGLVPAIPRTGLQGILSLLGVRGLNPQQRQLLETFERQGISPLASDITGSRAVAGLENVPTRFPVGVAPTQRFAEQQLEQAQTATQRALQPLGPAVGTEETGLRLRADVARQVEGQRGTAEQTTRQFVEAGGTPRTFVDVGMLAEKDVKTGIRAFGTQKRELFDEVERLAGDDPVVTLTKTKAEAANILEQSREIGSPAPRGTGAIKRLGEPDPDLKVGGVPLRDLPPSFLATLPADMRAALAGDQPITFALARRIETEMGRIGYATKRPVPESSVEGSARRLYHAIRGDLDEFLTSPAGADVAPALAEAKQLYATQKRLFNDSILRSVTGKNFKPQTFIERVFSPRADVTDLLDFKRAVSDQTYQTATGALLAHGFDQATTATGVFRPEDFVRWAGPYVKTGRIDQILEPTQAQRFKQLVTDMSGLGESRITQIDKLFGTREPEKLVPLIFDPKLPSRTTFARSILEPDVFNDAARAWAQRLYQDSLSTRQVTAAGEEFLSPTKLANHLEPYLKSGQLDVILADFPDVAGELRDIFPLLRRLGRGELLAGNPSGTGQAILGASQVLGGLSGIGSTIRSLAIGDLPTAAAVGGGTAALVGGPLALGTFTRSPTGIRVLSEGLADKFSPGALRLATRILGQQTGRPAARQETP